MNKIAAGIVTFEPDLSRLKENVDAISNQVERVIIVDNGSSNNVAIRQFVSKYDNVLIVSLEKNFGIAKALNEIFVCAHEEFDWVLTLDQDSVVIDGIVSEYQKYISNNDISSLTCLRIDRNEPDDKVIPNDELEIVSKCITSGNMVRISAWDAIGGFNERLFIDMVDNEFCYRLRRAGYSIHRVNKVLLIHELGRATYHRFLWRMVRVNNHSAMRKYHIVRNSIYLMKRYPKETRQDRTLREIVKIVIFTILYESNKLTKIRSMLKGVIDSKRID